MPKCTRTHSVPLQGICLSKDCGITSGVNFLPLGMQWESSHRERGLSRSVLAETVCRLCSVPRCSRLLQQPKATVSQAGPSLVFGYIKHICSISKDTCVCVRILRGNIKSLTSGAHKCSVVQSCPTLCDPLDCSPPDSSVHGILQARILEWVAISSSRRSSRPRD